MAKSKTRTRSRTHPPHPTDRAHYQPVKARIYNQNPTHSAYRSGMVVKAYKKDFGKKLVVNFKHKYLHFIPQFWGLHQPRKYFFVSFLR